MLCNRHFTKGLKAHLNWETLNKSANETDIDKLVIVSSKDLPVTRLVVLHRRENKSLRFAVQD